jgi:hypothetical protein
LSSDFRDKIADPIGIRGERDHQLQRFLQTDAAINRGNSGGPLLNINGEGLRIEAGLRTTYATSRFEAYGHEISIELLGVETTAIAYFFADPGIERNVLGRRGWLDRMRFGLVHYDQVVYIADYNK